MIKDPYFGTGLLVVKNIGDMADKLNKNSQPAKQIAYSNKQKVIDALISKNKKDEAITILKSSSKFEMKFDNIRATTEAYYERMIDIFLSDNENRFSAMIVNKQNPEFDGNGIQDSWETYTKYAANLAVKEMRNMPKDNLCIIVDEITRPRNKPLSLEDTILSKIRTEVLKDQSMNFENIFGAFSIESHSNFLLQLSDLLLGAVMYDYKKKSNLVSHQTNKRKEPLVKKIRNALKVKDLAHSFTDTSLAYFNVSECV
jgi:hypothetical protein